MYLCLDLSLSCTGYAKFTDDGKLISKGRIIPAKDIDNLFKMHYIVKNVRPKFKQMKQIIIEDVYYGKNFKSVMLLARLSGAIIYSWINYKYKVPVLYNASHARKLVGEVKGNAHKAEIQIYVLRKYNFLPEKAIIKYQEKVDELKETYKNKKITKGKFKYQMNKLSKLIDTNTGIGEDQADAIILGLAYQKEIK